MSFNRLFRIFLPLFSIVWLSTPSLGQSSIGIGQWRVHYPYASTHSVVEADNKIYCASKVSLYYFDNEDEALHLISKKDGLSGVDITKIGAYKSKEVLVGYTDGNIDFINGENIQQFDDIQRSSVEGSKAIRHFSMEGDEVLVSTDYGLSVLNMAKREVSDSYINISADGSSNPFYASVLSQDRDSIFVVSEQGVMAARYSSGVNLKDYNNWTVFDVSDGLPTAPKKTIGRLNNIVYVGVDDNGVYYFDGTSWQASSIVGSTGFEVRSIVPQNDFILISAGNKVYQVTSPTLNTPYTGANISVPNDAIFDRDGELWISEKTFGLIHYIAGQTYVTIPSGPYTTDVYRLKYIDNKVFICPGGLNTAFGRLYIDGGFAFYTSEKQWTSYNRYDFFPDTRDILDVTYQKARSKWYFSSFGYGLVEWDGNTGFSLFDPGNSPLKSNQVSGLATSNDGTVWLGNTSMNTNDPFLYSIDKAGVWRSYIPTQTVGKYPLDIAIDFNGRKWIRLSTSGGIRGLMLFDEKTNSQIYFNEQSGAGALPNKSVNTIDIDKNGQVWLGTDEGIAIFTNPAQIKSASTIPDAYLPIVDGFPLFFDKKINCIKTDGGNRKWVGTTDGAFLLSEDGLQTIYQFNTENSPLTNNNIVTITIDEQSGEVFFGTDRGVVSYRGDATSGSTAHEDVKVFPNPVLANFDGFVGISGLANGARLKITDTSGKLIYETRANGSTATWNVKNYNGRRAAAGVYLLFSASEDGAEKFVGKIAVLE